MLSKALLAASRRPGLRRVVTGNPATRHVVNRFVAGEKLDDALAVVGGLSADGIAVTLDHLGEDITDRTEAVHNRDAYLALLEGLAPLGLGPAAEVSVKLSAFGQALPDGHDLALELVRPVVVSAVGQQREVGVLEGRRGREQARDVVDDLLQVDEHAPLYMCMR